MSYDFHEMSKDDLLVFLTDAISAFHSVTGEVRFGSPIYDEMERDFADRCFARNDEFSDLVYRVQELTGKQIKADPRREIARRCLDCARLYRGDSRCQECGNASGEPLATLTARRNS